MSQPDLDRDLPPIPEPFAPAPPPPAPRAGCGAPLLVGCGVGVALLLVLGVVVTVKARDLVEWAFRQTEGALVAALPVDTQAADTQRLHRAFDQTIQAVNGNRVPPAELMSVQRELNNSLRLAQRSELDRAGLLRLIEVLEQAGAAPVPEEPER